jgi:hypothetical protein
MTVCNLQFQTSPETYTENRAAAGVRLLEVPPLQVPVFSHASPTRVSGLLPGIVKSPAFQMNTKKPIL